MGEVHTVPYGNLYIQDTDGNGVFQIHNGDKVFNQNEFELTTTQALKIDSRLSKDLPFTDLKGVPLTKQSAVALAFSDPSGIYLKGNRAVSAQTTLRGSMVGAGLLGVAVLGAAWFLSRDESMGTVSQDVKAMTVPFDLPSEFDGGRFVIHPDQPGKVGEPEVPAEEDVDGEDLDSDQGALGFFATSQSQDDDDFEVDEGQAEPSHEDEIADQLQEADLLIDEGKLSLAEEIIADQLGLIQALSRGGVQVSEEVRVKAFKLTMKLLLKDRDFETASQQIKAAAIVGLENPGDGLVLTFSLTSYIQELSDAGGHEEALLLVNELRDLGIGTVVVDKTSNDSIDRYCRSILQFAVNLVTAGYYDLAEVVLEEVGELLSDYESRGNTYAFEIPETILGIQLSIYSHRGDYDVAAESVLYAAQNTIKVIKDGKRPGIDISNVETELEGIAQYIYEIGGAKEAQWLKGELKKIGIEIQLNTSFRKGST